MRRRIARQPRLLGGKAQHRREPAHRGAEQMIQHGETGLARRRRIRIAIKRVFADVETPNRSTCMRALMQSPKNGLVVDSCKRRG